MKYLGENSARELIRLTKNELANKAGVINYPATISTTWSGTEAPYTQNITISGMSADDDDTPLVDLIPSDTYATAQSQLADWGKIYKITTAANQITVYATDKTTIALPIQLKVVR